MSKKEIKNDRIEIRVSQQDKKTLKEYAETHKTTITEIVLSRIQDILKTR